MVSRASPARRAAFEVLTGVLERRGEPATLLHRTSYDSLSSVDRNLMTEITYGVLRWRNQLDFVLAAHSNRPLEKIDAVPLTALRIGVYQLRFSSRVPERAAVDESVRLAHTFGASWSASFVNAVLRKTLRQPDAPSLPRKEDDSLRYLSTTLSHPEWLARRYLERLGLEDAVARCRRQNEPPPVHVRVSPPLSLEDARVSLEADGVMSEPVSLAPRALRVVSGELRESSLYRAGRLCIQDAGAQLVSTLLDVSPGELVLDVCAAPGGKATALAEQASDGYVLALDRRHRRTALTRALAKRLGRTNVLPVTADGARLPVARSFAKILLDVPCTSLGTLRRNPDIKWRVTEDDLMRHRALQRELLHAAAEKLAPGGRLVYATCSSEPEENQDVVTAFLEDEPAFRLVPPPVLATGEGFFETRPERDDTDAHFAAILTRN
jgi:16S rRNA (cytosine967-C5)-methyltransferase